MLDMCSKPILCSDVAQNGRICSRLSEPHKVAPNAKSCRAQSGKAYPLVRPSMGYKNLFLSYKHFFSFKITHRKLSGQNVPRFFEKSKVNKSDK